MTKPRKTTTAKPAPTQITLAASRDIPLDQLVLAQSNVRRIKAGLSIEELAEDIARRGLLQGLSVRPILAADGTETGRYEIPAGGRRFRALQRLVEQKRLAKDTPIPCIVRADGLPEEDSLAENVQRLALHPLDQYRAFADLKGRGVADDDIAARFFVTPQVVRQRLKLAAASPTLLDHYAADELSLEQLMAFCVSDDHARQEQVWAALQQGWNREPYLIRRLLTDDAVEAGDRRAVFVGIPAYETAGGIVLRDLFQQDRGGWLQDPALLDRLALAKLEAAAADVRAEGWGWVTVGLDFAYGHAADLARITGTPARLTAAEEQARATAQAEYDALVAAHDDTDELPAAVDARLGELEATLEGFDDRPLVYAPAEAARAGAFVSVGSDGALRIERGFVRPGERAPDALGDTHGRSPAPSTEAAAATAEADRRSLPDRLVTELTVYRTVALRDALAQAPDIAFRTVLHRLCLSLFQRYGAGNCLEIEATRQSFTAQAAGLAETTPARAIEARHADWERQLPEAAGLWAFLGTLDAGRRMALFAHCASLTVNAVQGSGAHRASGIAHADQLADALGLDLVASGWQPTAANYLGRVSKAQILDAVREVKGMATAQRIAGLKKADMAREAERLLAGTGWLPEPLRPASGAVDPEPLPSSLEDDDDANGSDALPAAGDASYAVAAE